jgi:hypothetical protein
VQIVEKEEEEEAEEKTRKGGSVRFTFSVDCVAYVCEAERG